jgi:hypothetical protein
MKNKYHAKKCEWDGEVFDSKKELQRYKELKLLEKAGEIQNLRRQVKYVLIPSQRIDGKVVEREVAYKADFVYEADGETVVEDAKGVKTTDYIIKRKMMLLFHNIRIKEV